MSDTVRWKLCFLGEDSVDVVIDLPPFIPRVGESILLPGRELFRVVDSVDYNFNLRHVTVCVRRLRD